jgi:hypothetical protein
MRENVINFPVCQVRDKKWWLWAGRRFKSRKEVVDAMSDRDWRRASAWESRHADWLRRYTEKHRGEGSAA